MTALAATHWPATGRACSNPAPPISLVGSPVDGELDVPTDVVPFFDSITARLTGIDPSAVRFTLTSGSGDVVRATAARSQVWTFAVTPERRLEPNTMYTLKGEWATLPDGGPAEASLVFTTGAGPVAAEPSPPRAHLQHYKFEDVPLTSCSPQKAGTCVSVPARSIVEYAFADGSKPDATAGFDSRYLMTGPFFTNISGIEQGYPFDCVRLRERAANGTYSSPLLLCRPDGAVFTITGNDRIGCTADGLTHDGNVVVVPPDAGGNDGGMDSGATTSDSVREGASCTISAHRGAATPPPFFAVFGSGLLALARSRARRRQGMQRYLSPKGALKGRSVRIAT